ncbi:integrase core domain-containing protein [Leptospira santarosai]|nr:integrase core domain-containing protein [Leptospira santarosai]MDI7211019.1 integrase core domain-containing protein [Leptospira santarosai]MDI7214809.1 integrase core domain-containing protein [Leptospira santarosai]MDI7219802.1 integrase core domain-containing protein [Leptospira santarosai]
MDTGERNRYSFSAPGKPAENAFIESFNGKMRNRY